MVDFRRGKSLNAGAVESGAQSEYSPWALIFARIEGICNAITEASYQTRLGRADHVGPLFYALAELYEQLVPLLSSKEDTEQTVIFGRLEKNVRAWKSVCAVGQPYFPVGLAEELQAWKRELYILKQKHNLNLPSRVEEPLSKKISRAVGGSE